MIPQVFKDNAGPDKSKIFKNLEKADAELPNDCMLPCCNDFIAIVPILAKTSIVVTTNSDSTLGRVVGVGPGLASDGCRVPPTVSVGDVVLYNPKSVAFRCNLKDTTKGHELLKKYQDMDFEVHITT